jgi:hypothetical protein
VRDVHGQPVGRLSASATEQSRKPR